MLFCSQSFLVFFLAVAAIYWTLPWAQVRVWLLLAASFGFYAAWNHWLAILVCGTAGVDFYIARILDGRRSQRCRRALVAVSIAVNLAVLVYFKYVNFFLDSLRAGRHAAGVEASLPV